MDDAGREKPPYQACYPADSLHLGMPLLQTQGHNHGWVRWAPPRSELVYPNTHSISKASHKHRGVGGIPEAAGTVHPRLQALPPAGQKSQLWLW